MSSMTAGDVLVNTLTEWGVDTVVSVLSPALIEATVDPSASPTPPKYEAKQATNFVQAKGTRDGTIALSVFSGQFSELV